MKYFSKLLFGTLLGVFGLATGTSAQTFEVGSGAKISLEMKGPHAYVTWTEPLAITEIHHWRGHLVPRENAGPPAEYVKIKGKSQVIRNFNPAKDGFSYKLGGDWGHLECGTNSGRQMPTFVNLEVDCSRNDGRQLVGALVVKGHANESPPQWGGEADPHKHYKEALARSREGNYPRK